VSSRIPSSRLSPRARAVWAKSERTVENEVTGWLPLYQHLDDSAAVAERLWIEWVPEAQKRMIRRPFGDSPEAERAAKDLFVWLTSIHDVGKASPAFAIQVPRLAQQMSDVGLVMDSTLAGSEERRVARHEIVSHLAAVDWLESELGFSITAARRYGSVLAAHHGLPADDALVRSIGQNSRLIGDSTWAEVRRELLAAATVLHASRQSIERWRAAEMPQHVLVLLSGLVIVADWIASDEGLFPYASIGQFPDSGTEQRVTAAWSALDLGGIWRAPAPADDLEGLFSRRFRLPEGALPRPMQRAFVELAASIPEPGLMILEAEMGSGKTEAALAAAEVLAGRFNLGGVFIALPTQATADGMFDRVLDWATRLGLETPSTVFLAHRRSGHNTRYAELRREAYFRSIGENSARRGSALDREAVIANHWLSDPKRGPLAHLVIGTIDQALFAGLRSRHLMLRHLALAGKVVILDEVHAYSAYMSRYLDRVVYWLAAYGVPIIMLSATLPAARRRALVEEYDRGRRAGRSFDASPAPLRPAERVARYGSLDGDVGYPSIISSGESGPSIALPRADGTTRHVAIERIDDSLDALIALLRESLREGGCVAVIRNTVRSVQETARALRDVFPDIEITVAHSRFLAKDRASKDAALLQRFGPPNEGRTRPLHHIVVASQVIEQSLDIDFDLLITDIAPMDLLLQRAGRLHRHVRESRPAPLQEPRLVITDVDWSARPPEPGVGTSRVYDRHLLYRTLAAIHDRQEIRLPDDIPGFVQSVYGEEPLGPSEWSTVLGAAKRAHLHDVSQRQREADGFLLGRIQHGDGATLLGWVHGQADDPATEARGRASVRDGDESLEVLLLRRDAEGTLRIPGPEGEAIPLNTAPLPRLARSILDCSVRLPSWLSRQAGIDALIETLEADFTRHELQTWHSSPLLQGELVVVLEDGSDAIIDVRSPRHDDRRIAFRIHYDDDIGLEVSRHG